MKQKKNNPQPKEAAYFRNYAKNDPQYAKQEAQYGQAIPSRPFLMELLEQYRDLTFEEISKLFGFNKEWQREALEYRLNAMMRAGQLYRSRDERYRIMDPKASITGVVEGHPEGFGFLTPDEGGDDLFIPPQGMRRVMHGDRVSAKVAGFDNRNRRIAAIDEVLEHNTTEFIARLFREGPTLTLVPENRKISNHFAIEKSETKNARHLDIVRAEILEYPSEKGMGRAKVIELFGDEITVEIEIEQALLEHDIPHIFPDAVKEEVKAIPVEVTQKEHEGRKDYREIPLVTIDGITARDFDDAVYCKPMDFGYRLYVAIADVSHYVRLESAISNEAENRGNSVYFPNRVIPMLPVELSNGICSLNPDVDRLCMVAELDINRNGELIDYHFFEGVMRSHARLTYTLVHQIIEGDELLRESYSHLTHHLDALYDLYKILNRAREKRGTIDFETTEALFLYDDQGNIENIVTDERNDAHKIIEECMITANIAAARFLEKHKMSTLYRIHQRPEEDKLTKLRALLHEFNLGLGGGEEPTPKDFAVTLEAAKKLPEFEMIQMVMLRSLKQAIYSPENNGHFGLSLTHYAHFTSPIRRYPDLLVHRAIKHILHNRTPETFVYTEKAMVQLGEHTSMTERRADEAVRDVIDWLKAEYLQQFVGEEFDGHIKGVTNFGLFVELDELFVEGLVHISTLSGDFYQYDEEKHRLIGERTRQQYRLNDPVRIRIKESNPETKHIDFTLISPIMAEGKGGKRRKAPAEERNRRNKSRAKRAARNSKSDESAQKKKRRKKRR